MKHLFWIFLVAATSGFASDPALLTVDEFVKDWQISRQFTLDVAEKMPENDYGFKATPAEMSFGELMLHVADSSVYRFWQLSGVKPPYPLAGNSPKLSKAEVIDRLAKSFDYVLRVLPALTPQQLDKKFKVDWKGRPEATGRQMILNMFVHVAHHRAQAEVYLRLKGIEPPAYTF
jgi:uncharacterized damage-inducible protein DinB